MPRGVYAAHTEGRTPHLQAAAPWPAWRRRYLCSPLGFHKSVYTAQGLRTPHHLHNIIEMHIASTLCHPHTIITWMQPINTEHHFTFSLHKSHFPSCTCVEYPADHPRQHDAKERQNLQISCQQWAAFCMGQGLSSQRSLHNHLQRITDLWLSHRICWLMNT